MLRRLVRLYLAAGKLPETRQRFALGALAEEHAALVIDQRASRDENDWLCRVPAHPRGYDR